MKKGLIALAVVALATSAFAQDVPKAAKTFTLSGGVDAYYLDVQSIGGLKGYQHADYATARSRPLFKVADGTSEFDLEFELIGNMGVQPALANTAAIDGGNGSAPISNDQTNSFRLRGMYFSSSVAYVDGLRLTAGLCPTLDLGMWEKDLSPGFTAAYTIGKLATISVAWFDVYEQFTKAEKSTGLGGDSRDTQYFSATALVAPIDGLQVNLMGAYEVAGKDNTLDPNVAGLYAPLAGTKGLVGNKKMVDGTSYMGGAWVKGTFGQFGVTGIFQYASYKGKQLDTVKTSPTYNQAVIAYKGAAYAFNISPSFSLDKDTTFAVFYTNISGDDPKTAKNESWWDATLDAQGFGHKMILFEDCGCCANLDITNASQARVRAKGFGQTYGYTLYGATATGKVGIYVPTLAVAYGTLNQAVTGMKKDLGVEIDLFNAFKISDATTLNLEFAYLVTGKAYKSWDVSTNKAATVVNSQKIQNASSIALGMTQKI